MGELLYGRTSGRSMLAERRIRSIGRNARICACKCRDTHPVSYTHLDVYKRQLINSVNDTKIVKVLVGYEASSKKYWKNSFTLRIAALAKLF